MTQMPETPTCPKCDFEFSQPFESCPACGVIVEKYAPERRKVVPSRVQITTGDLPDSYDILKPVYFSVSNKGLFSSQLKKLAEKHGFSRDRSAGEVRTDVFWLLAGEWPVEHQDFPRAFAVCLEELKIQAAAIGGDAIIWLRQDVDLDTDGFQFFYMQAYGTAVRRKL